MSVFSQDCNYEPELDVALFHTRVITDLVEFKKHLMLL